MKNTILLDATSPGTAMTAIMQAVLLLRAGGLVAFPTETVYGLGADAFREDAVNAVFGAKGRPSDNPLIVHVGEPEDIFSVGVHSARAVHLAQAFMPGPLTLVMPSLPGVPSVVRAGLSTVAVRVPSHPVAMSLLSLTGPLVAPSANRSGRPSPTTAGHVMDDLSGLIDAVLDGGRCAVGIESTVVDISGERVVVLRPGAVEGGQIQDVLGEPVLYYHPAGTAQADYPRSPGMKHRHYAPTVPVFFTEEPLPVMPALPEPWLILTNHPEQISHLAKKSFPLDEATFYDMLRCADTDGYGAVLILSAPGELSEGLLDRVRRAAGLQ